MATITPSMEAALKFCNGYEDHKDNLLWFLTNMINKSGNLTRLSLLSTSSKWDKATQYNHQTTGIYLAPANEAGINMCAYASKGCRTSCLGHSNGFLKFDTHKERRIKRALLFHLYPDAFMAQLVSELQIFILQLDSYNRVHGTNIKGAIRLNGSSEIFWEQLPYTDPTGTYPNIMARFPNLQFYDYTKAPKDKRPNIPDNYRLTFSIDERKGSVKRAIQWLKNGGNAALVVRTRSLLEQGLAEGIGGFPCVDGDAHDLRHLDPPGHVVLLKAKGDATKDNTGFTRHQLAF
jgi:hypothetical protein